MGVIAEREVPKGESESRVGDALATLRIRVAGRLQLGLHHRSTRYGLRRDLRASLQMPKAKIPIAVRPMVPSDLAHLLSLDETNQAERLEIARRRAFVERYPNGCFVAVDERTSIPCYMQWLIGSADNHLVQRMGGFPQLAPGEALLENAFTPARYRGMGIMSEAMALIAACGRDVGADYVMTFVEQGNIASLKGCQRAGFFPHLLHHKTQTLYGILSRDTFEALAPDDERRTLKF